MNLRDAAERYWDEHAWVTIPLRKDPATGLAKIPFTDRWQQTPADWEQIAALDWERAEGIGIVLGPVSDNLAVIDVDSVTLTDAMLERLSGRGKFYAVRTGRNRSHWYFREGTPTPPQTFHEARWQGETFSVELKGQGQQVAAPPTPGYSLIGTTHLPTPVATLSAAWGPIARTMGVTGAERTHSGSAGYPAPWRETVQLGRRNNALYVESCRLAEAGMPLESAIATMLARLSVAYEGATDRQHDVGTIRSAYRRVLTKQKPRGGVAT